MGTISSPLVKDRFDFFLRDCQENYFETSKERGDRNSLVIGGSVNPQILVKILHLCSLSVLLPTHFCRDAYTNSSSMENVLIKLGIKT